nr:nucleolin 2-like isoform X1 [Coffea arabica]
MDGAIGNGDERTFNVNFGSEGVSKLREDVKEKLKEYMGEYTDDTLVEYIIVLLKNGRRKDEARNELNVFLDDASDSFVSWLWDHLASNLDLYAQTHQSHSDGALKTSPIAIQQAGGNDSRLVESKSVNLKSNKSFKARHTREWKGQAIDEGEQPRLRSSVADDNHADKDSRKAGNEKIEVSPQPATRRKRNRPEEQLQSKREVVSQAPIAAPRRLLQFAVRDAVATSRPSTITAEPSLKRLRSVVSTTAEDSNLEEHPQKIRSVARVPNAMATAIKAIAEAAKDVRRVRSSGNVFDRLGRPKDVSETLNQSEEFGEDPAGEGQDGAYIKEEGRPTYDHTNDYSRPYPNDVSLLQRDTRMVIDPASDNEDYDTTMDEPQTGNGIGISRMVPHSAANNADEIVIVPSKNQDQFGKISDTSHKIVSSSINLNTWKSPQHQGLRGTLNVDKQKSVQVNEALTSVPAGRLTKENNNSVAVANGNAQLEVDAPKESQKTHSSALGSYPIGRPTEDSDSRTIFVNNVHFAATKDSLSRHFNKFGEVLKVIILTDAATGQPKGSAYIEFMRKEAAENALSLDGTSFMSRILRVVRKNSAQQEAFPIPTWPRIARGSPYAVSRFGRAPFSRGIGGAYRSRLLTKPGPRSFQWKRETQPTQTEILNPGSSNTAPSSISRSLTYVRPEPKTNESSSAA